VFDLLLSYQPKSLGRLQGVMKITAHLLTLLLRQHNKSLGLTLSIEAAPIAANADAQEAAERSLRNKFGRLSNRRILSVLRPTAEKVDELRGLPDKQLLDDWFTEFTRLRSEMQKAP
jgi:hypothetical protein